MRRMTLDQLHARANAGNVKGFVVFRGTHETAAHLLQLAAEIQEAIDDPWPSVPNEEVMARMNARIVRHQAAKRA